MTNLATSAPVRLLPSPSASSSSSTKHQTAASTGTANNSATANMPISKSSSALTKNGNSAKS